MNFIKKFYSIKISILAFIFFNSFCITGKEYLSINASISADKFVTLEQAYKNSQQSFQALNLTVLPIGMAKYHMTLNGFDVDFDQKLSHAEKIQLQYDVKSALEKATNDAIKKTLKQVKNNFKCNYIRLVFNNITIFAKKTVALFKSNAVIQGLVDLIENYFHNNVKLLVQSGRIKSIKKHQAILTPHVSLGKITNQNLAFGQIINPGSSVADFHISKPKSIISVQLRKN